MRFVLASFVVMGLIFYELSGGADFEPPQPPVVAERSASNRAAEPVQARAASVPQTLRSQPATQVATSAATPGTTAPARQREIRQTNAEDSRDLTGVRSSLRQGLALGSAETVQDGLTLASLELGAAGLRRADQVTPVQQAVASQPEPRDLREISGTRVNMRDGPGTTFPVVARLRLGDQVEVLSDSGTGWLRLRTLPERQLGWVSSSLIRKPAR